MGFRGRSTLRPTESGWPIFRLPVSSRRTRRDPEVRRLYREERFRRYLQSAGELRLPWGSFAWEGLSLGRDSLCRPGGWESLAKIWELGYYLGRSRGAGRFCFTAQPLPECRGRPRPPGCRTGTASTGSPGRPCNCAWWPSGRPPPHPGPGSDPAGPLGPAGPGPVDSAGARGRFLSVFREAGKIAPQSRGTELPHV